MRHKLVKSGWATLLRELELVESQMQLKEVIVTGFASATEKQSSPVRVSVVIKRFFTEYIDHIMMP